MPHRPPRLLFNCDGGSCSLSICPPPIGLDQLTRPVDELTGTGVDVFIHCLNRGADTYAHPTQVAEVYGAEPIDWGDVDLNAGHVRGTRNQEGNIRHLLAAGHDQVCLLQDRAHELGLRFWASLRMNDEHEDDVRRFGSKLSSYKKANPHLLVGEHFPRGVGAYCDRYDYTWTWNYAVPEVRQHQLAVLLEILDNYDVDGIEMDFSRGPWYFRLGEEEAGLPAMTDLVRQVSAAVRARSAERGRHLTLAARVRPSLDANRALGLDVETWIRQGLLDHVTPMDPGHLDMGADVEAFVALARAAGVSVSGGIEPQPTGYDRSSAQVVAAAQSFWRRGVDSIYLFNFDCHRAAGRESDYTAEETGLLRDLADPAALAGKGKHYTVTRDHRTPEGKGSVRLPLPRPLPATGQEETFTLHVADDRPGVTAPPAAGGPRVLLRVMLTGLPSADALAVQLNSQSLPSAAASGGPAGETILSYHAPPVRAGWNSIGIRHTGPPDSPASTVAVEGIELLIA